MFDFIFDKVKRIFRVRYIIKCIRALFFDRVQRSFISPKTLLIIRLDAIGDYILFRNFLEAIRSSEKYKNYKITLCGNELWKDIALAFDNQFVDEFIWVNYSRLVNNNEYRKETLNHIASKGFETAICPNAARNFLAGDAIVRASHAKVRIGSKSTRSIDNALFGIIGNWFYTNLIDNRTPIFEFDKNRVFFQELLNQDVSIQLPSFKRLQKTPGDYIMIFPGAGEPARKWATERFAKLVDELTFAYPYKILIGGAKSDTPLAQRIGAILKNEKANVEDLTGKTSLDELVRLIANARLVVAHDSGMLHMAIAADTNVVGLMTGKHYKRFGPYTHQPDNALLLFPKPEAYYEKLLLKYGPSYFESVINDINEITPEDAFDACKKLLL